MQQTGAADSFRGRPDQHDGVLGPGLFPLGIAKSAVQIEQRFAVLPNRQRRAQLTKALEVPLEKRRDSLAQFLGVESHRANLEGRAPSRPTLFCSRDRRSRLVGDLVAVPASTTLATRWREAV